MSAKHKQGRSSPYYGKLGVVTLDSEVYRIWLSRFDEPEDAPPHGWLHDYETDPAGEYERRDFLRRILDATPLTPREVVAITRRIIYGDTLVEAGAAMGVTKERVRQIIVKGFRRLRTHQEEITGIKPLEINEYWGFL